MTGEKALSEIPREAMLSCTSFFFDLNLVDKCNLRVSRYVSMGNSPLHYVFWWKKTTASRLVGGSVKVFSRFPVIICVALENKGEKAVINRLLPVLLCGQLNRIELIQNRTFSTFWSWMAAQKIFYNSNISDSCTGKRAILPSQVKKTDEKSNPRWNVSVQVNHVGKVL